MAEESLATNTFQSDSEVPPAAPATIHKDVSVYVTVMVSILSMYSIGQ